MARKVAHYAITNGLAGCYMPDTAHGPVTFARRRDLADYIRNELAYLDMPAALFREVHIRRLWSFIARNGASVAHFSLRHGNYELAFHGLTDAEAEAMEAECEQ